MRKYGYQIWKPTDEFVRAALLKQMEINNCHINQPLPDRNYKMVSEEVLDIDEHYELGTYAAGFSLTIWDMAKNYRKFKGEENFEMGDVIAIYHTNEEGKKYAACFLTVGQYFYGWDKNENKLLRDYQPVQEAWAKAAKVDLY